MVPLAVFLGLCGFAVFLKGFFESTGDLDSVTYINGTRIAPMWWVVLGIAMFAVCTGAIQGGCGC